MSGGKEQVRGGGYGKGFALIVVLFILLIIVGAAAVGGANYGGQCG
ncbi:YjcZ family sporulation protein, partial [Salinisphaera sp. USBA-960]|nr:YjcZ family sporulation protein [Salifodinibacter halophilus]